jgi:hypothetical protein
MQSEYPHNTDEQTADYLNRTLKIMADAMVAPENFAAVFPSVYGSVSGKQIVIERAAMASDLSHLTRPH